MQSAMIQASLSLVARLSEPCRSAMHWIRRLAQGSLRSLREGATPLPEPSIGTRGALGVASTDLRADFTSARHFHHRGTEHTEPEHT